MDAPKEVQDPGIPRCHYQAGPTVCGEANRRSLIAGHSAGPGDSGLADVLLRDLAGFGKVTASAIVSFQNAYEHLMLVKSA